METRAYTIGFFLSRASLAMRGHVNRLFREQGLGEVSMGFIGVLLSLYQADGQSLSELGEAVSLERSTMTGLIDRMERAGLVGREPDPADRRSQRVWLTDGGRKVRRSVASVLEESYRELTRGVADRELERLEELLGHIIDNSRRGP